MTDLIVKFACGNAEKHAEEFQRLLIDRRIIRVGVQPETQGSEVRLNFPKIQSDTIERIVGEAKPWCLDRALGLMRSSGETGTPQAIVVMIADLFEMAE